MKNPCIACQSQYPHCRRICQTGIEFQGNQAKKRQAEKVGRAEETDYLMFKYKTIYETKKRVGLV